MTAIPLAEQTRLIREGGEARAAGRPIDDCPHPKAEIVKRACWRVGWTEEDKARAKAARVETRRAAWPSFAERSLPERDR